MNHEIFTHHCIDDQLDIPGLEPWDEAMNTFRLQCPFLPLDVLVSDDGRTMTMRMRGMQLVDNYLRTARLIILMNRLPLTVNRDRWEMEGVVFEDNLVFTYDGKAPY